LIKTNFSIQFYLKRKITSNVIKLIVKNVQTKNKKTAMLVIQREIIHYFDHFSIYIVRNNAVFWFIPNVKNEKF
jgi:hypothetical protein